MKSFNHVILVLMPVCVIFIEVCFVKAYAQLADTMLCSDESCSETLSEGEARLAYRPRDDKFLNLKKGDIVLVKSKNAGKKTHLWGGEVMGSDRFGFFPSAFIKEYMVLVKSPNTSVSVQEFLRKRRSPIPEDPYADLVSPDKVVAKDYQDDGIQPGDKKDDTLHPGSPTQDVSDQKKERNEEVQQSTEDEQKMDHENPVAEEANELSQQKQDQSETPSKEEVTEKQSNDVDEHDTSHSHEEKNDEGVEKSQQDYALDASHKHEEGEHPDKAGKSDSEPVKLYDSDANDHSTNKKLDGAGGELKDSLKNIPPDIAALLGDPLMKKQEDSSETGAKNQTGDKVPSKEIDEKSKGDHDEKEAAQDASDDERQQTSDVTSHKTGENHEDDRQSSESTNEEQNKVKKEENVDADEESDEDHMEESHEQESGQYIPEVATDQDSPETVDGERKEATSIDEIKQVETKIHGKDDAIEEIKNVQKENDTSNKRWENHEDDKQSSESTNEKQDKVEKEEKVDAGEESQEEDHMKESDQQESGPYTPEMETDEESPGTIDSEGKEATDIGKTEQDGEVDAGEESESLQKENVADDKKESNSQVSSEPIHKDDQESPGEIDDERKEASDIGEAKQDGTENDGKVDASEESLQKENDADDKKESNDQGSGKPIHEEAENHEGDQESPGPTESEQKEATDTEMGEKSENPPKEGVETKDHIGSEAGENSSQDAASGEVEGDPTDPKNDVESSIHEKDRDGGDDEDLREQQQSNEIRDGEDDSQPSGKGAKQGHAGQGVDEKDRNEADLNIEENGKQQSDEKPQDFPSGTKPDTISATLTQGVAIKTEDGKAESKTTSKHQEKADEKVDVTIHKDSHGDSEDQESVKKSDDHGSDSKESDNLVGKEDDNENKENQDTEILPDNIGGAKQSGTDKGAETNARDVITSEPQSNGTETAKTSESIANVTIQKEAANTAEPIDPQRLRKDNENEAKETDHLLVDGGSSDEKSPQTMKKDPERDVLDGGGLPKDEMEDNIIANARDGTAEEHSSQDTPDRYHEDKTMVTKEAVPVDCEKRQFQSDTSEDVYEKKCDGSSRCYTDLLYDPSLKWFMESIYSKGKDKKTKTDDTQMAADNAANKKNLVDLVDDISTQMNAADVETEHHTDLLQDPLLKWFVRSSHWRAVLPAEDNGQTQGEEPLISYDHVAQNSDKSLSIANDPLRKRTMLLGLTIQTKASQREHLDAVLKEAELDESVYNYEGNEMRDGSSSLMEDPLLKWLLLPSAKCLNVESSAHSEIAAPGSADDVDMESSATEVDTAGQSSYLTDPLLKWLLLPSAKFPIVQIDTGSESMASGNFGEIDNGQTYGEEPLILEDHDADVPQNAGNCISIANDPLTKRTMLLGLTIQTKKSLHKRLDAVLQEDELDESVNSYEGNEVQEGFSSLMRDPLLKWLLLPSAKCPSVESSADSEIAVPGSVDDVDMKSPATNEVGTAGQSSYLTDPLLKWLLLPSAKCPVLQINTASAIKAPGNVDEIDMGLSAQDKDYTAGQSGYLNNPLLNPVFRKSVCQKKDTSLFQRELVLSIGDEGDVEDNVAAVQEDYTADHGNVKGHSNEQDIPANMNEKVFDDVVEAIEESLDPDSADDVDVELTTSDKEASSQSDYLGDPRLRWIFQRSVCPWKNCASSQGKLIPSSDRGSEQVTIEEDSSDGLDEPILGDETPAADQDAIRPRESIGRVGTIHEPAAMTDESLPSDESENPVVLTDTRTSVWLSLRNLINSFRESYEEVAGFRAGLTDVIQDIRILKKTRPELVAEFTASGKTLRKSSTDLEDSILDHIHTLTKKLYNSGMAGENKDDIEKNFIPDYKKIHENVLYEIQFLRMDINTLHEDIHMEAHNQNDEVGEFENPGGVDTAKSEILALQEKLSEMDEKLSKKDSESGNIAVKMTEEAEYFKARISELEELISKRGEDEKKQNIQSQEKEKELTEKLEALESALKIKREEEEAKSTSEVIQFNKRLEQMESSIRLTVESDKPFLERIAALEEELAHRKAKEMERTKQDQREAGRLQLKVQVLERQLKKQQLHGSSKLIEEARDLQTKIKSLEDDLAAKASSEKSKSTTQEDASELKNRISSLEEELNRQLQAKEASAKEEAEGLETRIFKMEQELKEKIDAAIIAKTDLTSHSVKSVAVEVTNKVKKKRRSKMSQKQILHILNALFQQPKGSENHSSNATIFRNQTEKFNSDLGESPIENTDPDFMLQMANADNGKNTAKMEDNEQLQDEVKTDSYDALHEGEIVSWDETIDEDLEKLRPPGWDEALGGDDEDTNIVKEERTENPERSDDTSLHDGHNESDIGERQDGAASHPRDESIVEGTHQKDAKVEPAAHEDEDSHENNSGIQPTAAPGEHRDENVTTISDLIHATEATQMSGMGNAADEEHLDTLNDSTAAEPIEHKDEVGADAADTASDARETEDTPGGNIDDDMGSDEGEVGAESDLHVESLPLRLLIVLYHFPFDILYILEPFFLLWISLLPEEYQNDVHGVSWSIVMSTFFIGFFMMWLLICRLRASSRKRKDELAVKTVQELRTQLDNIIQEKLERENELKAKQIELDMQRDEITTVAQEKFNIVTEKTTLEHSLREYSIQNDAFKRDVQVLNQQLQEKDNEMQEVLTNSDQVRNSLSAQQETISRYEDKIRQLQDVVTESGSDKKRMEDAIEKYKERVKALEKAKGETKREGKTWKDQAEKLNEKILDLEENLNAQKEEADLKRQEVDVLKDCILQFKGVQEYLTDEGEDAESEESIEKQKEKMRSMIDVSLVRSQLRQIEADRLQITYELEAEKKSRAETEGKVSELEATIQSNQTMKNKLERDRQTLESKLAVMQEFYAKREVEIQSKLGLEQSKRESNASMLEDHQKQHLELVQQLEAYKKMGEDAKHQYEEAERQHKQEILGFEKKKHENWLASRDAERKLDEANKQINQLHVELSDMQRRLRDSQDREPILRPRPERHGPPGAPPPFGPPRRGPPPGIPGSPLHFRNGPPPDIDRRSPPPFNRRPPSPGSSISEEKLSRPDRPPSRPDRPPSTHSLPPLDRRPPPGPPMGPGPYPGPPPPGRFGPYRDGMPRAQGPRGYHPHSRPPPGPRMGGPMTSSPYMEQSPIPPSASPGPRSQNFTQSSLHAPPPQMAGDSLRNEGLQPPPMGSNITDHPPQGTPTGRSSGASNPFRRAH